MTENKPIIIDGVDVSGCGYYQYDMCTATKDNYGDCSYYCKDYDMKNCYFKQLKRKEQECEGLKEELRECRIGIKDISIESTGICKISEKYKQALDEVEKYLDAQQKYFDGEDYHNLLDIINKVKENK